ncbi:serine O-acetyltransferase [Bacillus mycoides]|uniref:serine O-acetyltransferase n=1 Tax=Bacillus mycoides TaxID=1405 RepID=UPI003D65C0D6
MDFIKCFDLIKKDYGGRYLQKLDFFKFIKAYFLDINFRVVVRFRIQSYLYNKSKLGILFATIIRNGNIKKYGIEIGLNSKIGGGCNVHHINGIVIGNDVIIGEGFNVFQQVTIGKKGGGYPIIGNGVTIYPGAKVIGDISIGDNVIIGANSFVDKSITYSKIVAGIPAVQINKKEDLQKEVNYYEGN